MKRSALLLIAALALPLAGLGLTWADTHRNAQLGTDWDVPIQGYDPRDLLRGHYITYRYDWPGLTEEQERSFITELCIEGVAPNISRVTIPNMPMVEVAGEAPPKPPKCTITARAPRGGDNQGNGLEGGLYYLPQDKALDYEKKLANPKLQGVIRLRIRDDGITRPVGISFRPRPAEPLATPPQEGQDVGTIRR
jgi:hypothetical protein